MSHDVGDIHDVKLCRYDISNGMARSMSMLLLGEQLEAIWHTSIVVFGKEFYFDGGVGIVTEPVPGSTRFGTPLRSESLGTTSKSLEAFLSWVAGQNKGKFGPNGYNLMTNNCNHFTDAASLFLLEKNIPEDIRQMLPKIMQTPLGRMIAPVLQQASSSVTSMSHSSSPGSLLERLPYERNASNPPSQNSFANGSPAPSSPSDATVSLTRSRSSLSEEEEDLLSLCKVQLETCEVVENSSSSSPPIRRTIKVIEMLRNIFQRVIDHPEEDKYRSISTRSDSYISNIQPFEPYGVIELFRLARFYLCQENQPDRVQRWVLTPMDCCPNILERLVLELTQLLSSLESKQQQEEEMSKWGENSESHSPPLASKKLVSTVMEKPGVATNAKTDESPLFLFCSLPIPDDYIPLNISPHCSRSSLISICWLGDEYESFFGKCYLTPSLEHLKAWAVQPAANLEISVSNGTYTVLCVRKDAVDRALWIPVTSLEQEEVSGGQGEGKFCRVALSSFVFRPKPHYAIIRAFKNGVAHSGVMEPSRKCYIPYGGKALDVTSEAHVLCDRSCVPLEVLRSVDRLYLGERYFFQCIEASGMGFKSFDELCQCRVVSSTLPCDSLLFSGAPKRRRVETVRCRGEGNNSDATLPFSRSKLLVCHDFRGGYQPGDFASFSFSTSLLNQVYTPEYFHLLDYLVYFTHYRVSIPPREWIQMGRRNGVPVLGTVLLEGRSAEAGGEVSFLLSNPSRMARVIAALVEWCDVLGFDGYMINWEVSVSEKLAKRVLMFCKMLRTALCASLEEDNETTSSSDPVQTQVSGSLPCFSKRRREGIVLWYDAMTVSGGVSYQNGLTSSNAPFFHQVDGILTNYWWTPQHLKLSKQVAGACDREEDCFVGVDVFGRGTRFGGKFRTWAAVQEITNASLSVGLFAPGWTLECASGRTRHGYLQAEDKLWSSIQQSFLANAPALGITSLPMLTCFTSGAGEVYCHNGCIVANHSSWCQLSGTHLSPFFYFHSDENESVCTLPNEYDTSSCFQGKTRRSSGDSNGELEHGKRFILLPLGTLKEEKEERSEAQLGSDERQCEPLDPDEVIKSLWVYTLPLAEELDYVLPARSILAGPHTSTAPTSTAMATSASYYNHSNNVGQSTASWSGDRALQVCIPPSHHISLLRWRVPKHLWACSKGENTGSSSDAVNLLAVDLAIYFSPHGEGGTIEENLLSHCSIGLKVECFSSNSQMGTDIVNDKKDSPAFLSTPPPASSEAFSRWVSLSVKKILWRPEQSVGWFVVRFTSSIAPRWMRLSQVECVSAISLVNTSSHHILRCITIGGIAAVPVTEEHWYGDAGDKERAELQSEKVNRRRSLDQNPISPLISTEAKLFENPKIFPTVHASECIILLPKFYEGLQMETEMLGCSSASELKEQCLSDHIVTLFGEFSDESGMTHRTLFLGQYSVKSLQESSEKNFLSSCSATKTTRGWSDSENRFSFDAGDLLIRVSSLPPDFQLQKVKFLMRWGSF